MIVINKSSYLIPKDGRPNKYTTFLFGAIFQYNFSLQKNLKATKPIPHHQIYAMVLCSIPPPPFLNKCFQFAR